MKKIISLIVIVSIIMVSISTTMVFGQTISNTSSSSGSGSSSAGVLSATSSIQGLSNLPMMVGADISDLTPVFKDINDNVVTTNNNYKYVFTRNGEIVASVVKNAYGSYMLPALSGGYELYVTLVDPSQFTSLIFTRYNVYVQTADETALSPVSITNTVSSLIEGYTVVTNLKSEYVDQERTVAISLHDNNGVLIKLYFEKITKDGYVNINMVDTNKDIGISGYYIKCILIDDIEKLNPLAKSTEGYIQ